MKIEIKVNDYHYYVCDCNDGVIGQLPWIDEMCDVILPIFDKSMVDSKVVQKQIDELILKYTDWFDVFGAKSKWLHDEIDKASVRLGRQKAVGDGSPMTAWHEEIRDYEEMVDNACHGVSGGNDNIIIFVIGRIEDYKRFVKMFTDVLLNPDESE